MVDPTSDRRTKDDPKPEFKPRPDPKLYELEIPAGDMAEVYLALLRGHWPT